ncbi:hypothetical protein N7516_010603 [Penicillium verrucosum]|uniref:uncharacterized protein n=1 Tax=Penicillium verrucosum TaxID=60171 RepID=UPI00254574E8|nr:uncharacterized protein N7516_010603 [Penicillium verrucosum]KAJ5922900.1 hypothetical protein N7516_010603 [Penicillium verrucosum]
MSSCHSNCSEPPPPLSPDNDITGPGVITNYIASAGITVLIILLYFFLVFDPVRDPFEKDEKAPDDPPFRPNAIDLLITRKVRGWGQRRMSKCLKNRLEKSLVNCVVAMGDLQLVTGFSILVSGAVQLSCGLTVYEWQIAVYLAWFSCLTHLSCLMVLRSYLYVHTFGRTWRLVAMGLLAILLIVGLLPTANYGDLYNSRPRSSDYAKCYLKIRSSPGIALYSMILSVLTIAIGFISRVMKLHKMLSVTLWGGLRIRASLRARAILHGLYKWCIAGGAVQGLRFSLVYRPLFAVFLVARFTLDAWVSMFVEALWLFIAFFWGVLRLMLALNDTPRSQDLWTTTAGHNKGDWTFGQVVSLVLLVAPLMNLLDYFDQNPATGARTSIPRNFLEPHEPMRRSSSPVPPLFMEEVPDPKSLDGNWSNHRETLGMAVIYSLISMMAFVLQLFLPSINKPLLEILISLDWGIKVIFALTGTYGVVLFSLFLESKVSKERKGTRRCLQFLNLAFYVLSFNFGGTYPLGGSRVMLNFMQPLALGFYGLLGIMFR